ncbi:chaplin [Streptomyces sp. NPDC001480]|uniref:chaplin n=1 Tax=Streptomyces sp. NPDC001480 TaxID=3364577 RepID=UPI00368677C9
MRRVTRNGVIGVVAASGAIAVTMPVCAAFAADGASADGSAAGSPGLISGNTVQLPVHVPVNACGNTVNVVGLLNPAAGNACANAGGSGGSASTASGGGTTASGGASTSGGASARGGTHDSPGVLSGNGVQLPVDLPVNVSGNTVSVVGAGNPAQGNTSVNGPGDNAPQPSNPTPPVKAAPRPTPVTKTHPRPATPDSAPPRTGSALAHTGADEMAPAAAASAALLLAGTVLYRRFRSHAER